MRTFSIGFDEAAYDETTYARAVAAHLGTAHTELRVSATDARAVVPTLADIYDEPFADASQIPTVLLSALTQRHVTVSLSGDGGDELFGGYARYRTANTLWRAVKWMPPAVRIGVGRGGSALVQPAVDVLARAPHHRLVTWAGTASDRAARLLATIAAPDADALYAAYTASWPRATAMLDDMSTAPATLRAPLERMMYADTVRYLPDDILVKLDRASMAAGLEARVPLLDHRVVEFAFALPLALKLHGGQTKWPLRQVLYRRVSAALFERPKQGFSVPLAAWLRGPLREWAHDLLGGDQLARRGLLAPKPIRQLWNEHVSGRHDRSAALWNVLMFQSWLERWG